MAIQVVAWVLEESRAELGARLVLLALANHAHADGSKAYPAVEQIMKEARLSRRGVQTNLRKLEEEGHIVRTGLHPVTGTAVYRVIMEGGAQNVRPAQSSAKGGAAPAPKPSVRQPSPSGGGGSAGGSAGLRIAGKPADGRTWERTLQALGDFNLRANQSLSAINGAGQPSEAAKRIYLRLRDWPDLTAEKVADVIARTLSSRWWGDGAPSVGVVFGPKVFEENLRRKGEPTHRPRADWDGYGREEEEDQGVLDVTAEDVTDEEG